jgi:hypothetical protein
VHVEPRPQPGPQIVAPLWPKRAEDKTVDQLKQALPHAKLPTMGIKSVLVKRLPEHEAGLQQQQQQQQQRSSSSSSTAAAAAQQQAVAAAVVVAAAAISSSNNNNHPFGQLAAGRGNVAA